MGLSIHPSPVFVTNPPFLQYLAALGAKYMEKRPKKSWKNEEKIAFLGFLYRKSRSQVWNRRFGVQEKIVYTSQVEILKWPN